MIWNMNIADNPEDERWVRWKAEYIAYNQTGMGATFVIVCDGTPVGEGTLLFSVDCKAVDGRSELAGKEIANINALRIRKEYEGQGHISNLMRLMEAFAANHGYTRLSIGVEEKETRNLSIYHHWGYDQLITRAMEDGEKVLYFTKELNNQ